MTNESDKPGPDQPAKTGGASAVSREEMMAAIKARADALRAAKSGAAASGPAAETPAVKTQAAVETPASASGQTGEKAPGGTAPEASREDKLAAVKARAEALRAAKAAGGGAAPAAPGGGAAASAAPSRPAAAPASLDVPVSSLNPGGRPGAPPRAPALEAFGTLNQSVEIRGDAGENENLKKLLGGLGAYQNPLRSDSWQIDYRYYAEAKKRLEAAGYTLVEKDFLGRRVATWSPASRGWTRVES